MPLYLSQIVHADRLVTYRPATEEEIRRGPVVRANLGAGGGSACGSCGAPSVARLRLRARGRSAPSLGAFLVCAQCLTRRFGLSPPTV